VPVVSVVDGDGDTVIVGLDERRLADVLGLNIPAAAGGPEWLAGKYEVVFDALQESVRRIGQARIDTPFVQRRMTLRAHVLHIVSFAEGGWLAHRSGHFTIDDMLATTARCESITTVDAICDYIDSVGGEITAYARSADAASLDHIVSSHYGGEVSVLELMRIMLRHGAHHMRQLEWFMGSELGVAPDGQLSAALPGITVPDELFAGT
jgi:hypothetical protein